jgi:CubicO group peptidase (beta-lactamase class C family)
MARSPRDIERIHSTQEVMANFAVSQTLWTRTSRSGSRSRAYELEVRVRFRSPSAGGDRRCETSGCRCLGVHSSKPNPSSRSGRCGRVGYVTTALEDLLARHVETGTIQGAVALLGRGDDVEVAAVGVASDDGLPMPADAIMRIQSMTKVITSVAALRLVESGRLGLDQSVAEWLPELVNRRVLISPTAPLEDTVPARRAITLRHLLTNASGYGMSMTDSPLLRAMAENGTEA